MRNLHEHDLSSMETLKMSLILLIAMIGFCFLGYKLGLSLGELCLNNLEHTILTAIR